jgi:anti-sigma regulatory factor (Ser/Thr protein kinase)
MIWSLRKGDYLGSRAQRKAFRAFLTEHFETDRVELHELVFGELVTNAVRHGEEPISVFVAIDEHVVQIQTENGGECFDLDRRLRKQPSVTSGRGLQIVNQLADALTVDFVESRCRVTAVVQL